MIRRIKYLVLILIIVLVGVAFILYNNYQRKLIVNNNENDNEIIPDRIIYDGESFYSDKYIEEYFGVTGLTDEEKQLMIYYDNNHDEMLLKMAQKGNSWRCFPVEKSIKDRYDEKEGILSEYDFDSVEYSKETLNDLAEYGSVSPISFVGIKGNQKKKIYFYISSNYGLVRLDKDKVIDLTDENGNELDTRLKCNETNWIDVIHNFASQNIEEQDTMAFTNRFKQLYKDSQDAILKKIPSHIEYSSIMYSIETEEQSDYSTLTAIYRCFKLTNTQEKRLYKVHFILDSNLYIDDIEVEIIE